MSTDQIKELVASVNTQKFDKITICGTEGISIIDTEEILYCESSSGGYTNLYSAELRLISSKPLKYYEDILPPTLFFRIHQSYLINIQKVKKYLKEDGGLVEMTNGNQLLISRRNKDHFLKLLMGEDWFKENNLK